MGDARLSGLCMCMLSVHKKKVEEDTEFIDKMMIKCGQQPRRLKFLFKRWLGLNKKLFFIFFCVFSFITEGCRCTRLHPPVGAHDCGSVNIISTIEILTLLERVGVPFPATATSTTSMSLENIFPFFPPIVLLKTCLNFPVVDASALNKQSPNFAHSCDLRSLFWSSQDVSNIRNREQIVSAWRTAESGIERPRLLASACHALDNP